MTGARMAWRLCRQLPEGGDMRLAKKGIVLAFLVLGLGVYWQARLHAQDDTCPVCPCGDAWCDGFGNCTCPDQPSCDCGDAWCSTGGYWVCDDEPYCDYNYEAFCEYDGWACEYVGSRHGMRGLLV